MVNKIGIQKIKVIRNVYWLRCQSTVYHFKPLLCDTGLTGLSYLALFSNITHPELVRCKGQRFIRFNFWYEQRFTKTRTTTRVRASKWGTAYASASKRGKCVSTQMQPQKSRLLIAQDTQQKLGVAFPYLELKNYLFCLGNGCRHCKATT